MARAKNPDTWYIIKDGNAKKKYAPKMHKTTYSFNSDIITIYQHWKKYMFNTFGITEPQLKVLAQLNNQESKQTAHCIAYNIHLPVQKVNRLLDELWNKNLINIHKRQNKPTEKHPRGVIYKTAIINNYGKEKFNSLASFHKKYYQL